MRQHLLRSQPRLLPRFALLPALMQAYVALLRGINVGGKGKVPMKDLVAMFRDAGCGDVETYIQSGNVVFRADAALAARIPDAIGKAIADRFGFRPPIVLRSAAELRAVVRGNPFRTGGADPTTLHVVFLGDAPAAAVATLDPKRSPPDEFQVRGREIYLRCPNGYGRSKLTNDYFESKLRTTSTVRNWRTVETLLAMSEG